MIDDLADVDNNPVIVLNDNGWQQGIIGIVASKITERYGLPSILISFDGSMGSEETAFDDGKGSGRSIKGLNLVEALGYCDDLLVKYGGHELAAGLMVKRGNLDEFCARINEYAREHLDDDAFKVKMDVDLELQMSDISIALVNEINKLEPCGTENPIPLFVMKNLNVKKITPTKGGEHTRLLLEKDGACINAMYFGVGEMGLGFECGDLVDVVFNVDINDYKNVQTVQLIIRDARIADTYSRQLKIDKERYQELKAGGTYSVNDCVLPTREDCARVYTWLRKEYRSGNALTDTKTLLRSINQTGEPKMNYTKIKYIFDIFNELQICDVDEISEDIFSFNVIFRANKTSIDKSAILRKLRSQCVDRNL